MDTLVSCLLGLYGVLYVASYFADLIWSAVRSGE